MGKDHPSFSRWVLSELAALGGTAHGTLANPKAAAAGAGLCKLSPAKLPSSRSHPYVSQGCSYNPGAFVLGAVPCQTPHAPSPSPAQSILPAQSDTAQCRLRWTQPVSWRGEGSLHCDWLWQMPGAAILFPLILSTPISAVTIN